MSNKLVIICWLMLSICFNMGGEFYSKKFVQGLSSSEKHVSYMLLLLLFYLLASVSWLPAVAWHKTFSIASVGTMWMIIGTFGCCRRSNDWREAPAASVARCCPWIGFHPTLVTSPHENDQTTRHEGRHDSPSERKTSGITTGPKTS